MPGTGSNRHGRTSHRTVGQAQVDRVRHRAGAHRVGGGFRPQDAARCAARHLRPAGHRLHRVDGAQPRSGRGPDHLPARPHAAEHARRRDRARLLDVRHELHLRAVRRGHRHLLGPYPGARAARPRAAAAAARRDAHTGSGRQRRRLGLSIRVEGRHRTDGLGRAPRLPGLHGASGVAGRGRRGGGGLARRVPAPVPDPPRPRPPRRVRSHARRRHPVRARRQRRSRRSRARTGRPRVRAARPRLREGPGRSREERRHGGAGRDSDPAR